MSDTTELAETAEVAPEQAQTESEGKGLRKQLETALKENRALKADKRDEVLTGIGLDPTKGLGKALVEQFDDGKVSIDTLQETAVNEYGHVIPEAIEQHPQAQQIATETARVEELGQTAGSVAPPSQADALAKAEAEGDMATTMAIKGQQVADMFK